MEQQTENTTAGQSDDISLKELILKAGEWFRYTLSKWRPILLTGLLGASTGLGISFFSKPEYTAELTFVLEDNKSNALSSYAGLASQFGIDLGGGGNSGIFSGDNILAFLRSRLLIEKTLLSPISGSDKSRSLADFYIDVYKLREKFQKNEKLRAVGFPVNGNRNKFSIVQDSLLHVFYANILTQNLNISKPDKKLSFVSVKLSSPDELFSKHFSETLVKEAIDFYVTTKTKRSKFNVDKLQLKADSIELMLNKKTYSAAATQDLNLNPVRSIARVSTEVEIRDKIVLQTMYAEVIKNLELSRMAMAQETPIIQIVDTPILPLKKTKFSKLKGLVFGGVLGGFLSIFIVLIIKLYKEIMK